ncbi:alcohol dehydrogenase [Gracilibacillus halophilus YIM-C55.5]|uniref:Alcohol dehydrogenase n=1 Tax=Gracilibacillus halophilus YIM-C55.5 TaxID=1308866 RepID=N4WVS8_9BACI|nr:alcohol dehydrogenase [Gracilibacillus halophilus YIM-C55.5]
MKAYVLRSGTLSQEQMKEPVIHNNQVKIKMKSAGLNHRDLKIPERYTKEDPLILGSDGLV